MPRQENLLDLFLMFHGRLVMRTDEFHSYSFIKHYRNEDCRCFLVNFIKYCLGNADCYKDFSFSAPYAFGSSMIAQSVITIKLQEKVIANENFQILSFLPPVCDKKFSQRVINPSCTKVFGTHTFYRGGGGGGVEPTP